MRPRWPSTRAVATSLAVGLACVFVWLQLQPHLLLARTTPAGGDMGAHVWGPAYLRDHLLDHGRLAGWTPDWYAGFPAFHFYMVVPMLAIVVLDVVLPYAIAFKLVTVAGVVLMPVAAWAMARLAGLRYPAPPLFALATVPFLFSTTWTIYGGNVASTLAGEFAFSISLSFALLFLGTLAYSLRTGERRGTAAVLLALTALCHLIPALFAAAGALALWVTRPDRARLRLLATVIVTGGALGAFWALPFVMRRPYLNDMGWEKLTNYGHLLLPEGMRVVAAVAAAGVLASFVLRIRFGMALSVTAAIMALGVYAAPQGRLWNARLTPFWYLLLFLLAALVISEILSGLGNELRLRRPEWPDWRIPTAGLALAGIAVFMVIGRPLHAVPSWVPFSSTTDSNFVKFWAEWNYSGYERKDAYPEYQAIVSTMATVGRERGCGRAMWEYQKELDRFGTPMALMLLPHWTDGCIGSMEGLYFEASATTPYHFLIQSELSAGPSRPQRDLPYRSVTSPGDADGDGKIDEGEVVVDRQVFDAGIRHLQILGVRYYMSFTPALIEAAGAHPDLTEVASSPPWRVFEVADTPLVEGLEQEPIVVKGVSKGGRDWQDFAVEQFQRDDLSVMATIDGPDSWVRLDREAAATAVLPRQPLPPVQVTGITTDTDRIEFDVDRVGVPVLVKVSYFPNWTARGAQGPYRVAPNLMIVVPTSTHVEMHYGWTPVDLGAYLITLLGLAALYLLHRRGRVALPEPPPPPVDDAEPGPDDEPPAGHLVAAASLESDA